ncbi:MAG: hypothetical protein NC187_04080 [Candidatus Amulumruptor caecigallinarius]|nr:hypothetical protein [Candidatus Amulumruptor caecigallinarius]MCM1396650.1 hypothetical protein [Candidatus Amulumruptor caecigallinarius]MCM1453292.1 hypothetical protein [bacterium]
MTQLIVSIDNPTMAADISRAIKMIKGVVNVKKSKATPNKVTLAAIADAAAGNTIHCADMEAYKRLVANLDDV